MKVIKLSAAEKEELEFRHRCCQDRKESDRIKAVLLRSEGWSVPMISQALRIHTSTIIRHLNDYREGKTTLNSGGSNSLLSEAQTQDLRQHLEITTYQTSNEIIVYIEKQYSVRYSVPGINKWLHRQGFSYKKPKGYPHKACPEKQAEFIQSYEQLKNTIGDDERIFFMDACHPTMATKITHGWIKKGLSKPIETGASRTQLNLVGALNLSTLCSPVVASYSTVDGESIVDFLQQLRAHTSPSGTIHLILDQAGYHRSAQVRLEANRLNIKLLYLPAYSPNLNPIERLWKVMNEQARNNRFFSSPTEFRQRIFSFFNRTLPRIASTLTARINDNFQNINYAF